jgi:hypothetical protein
MSGLIALLCPDDGLDGRGTARVEADELKLSAGEVKGEVKIDLLTPPAIGEGATKDGAGI